MNLCELSVLEYSEVTAPLMLPSSEERLSGPLPNYSPQGSLDLVQRGGGSRNLGQGLDGDMFMELAGACLEPQLCCPPLCCPPWFRVGWLFIWAAPTVSPPAAIQGTPPSSGRALQVPSQV